MKNAPNALESVELEEVLAPFKIENELSFSYYLKDVYIDLVQSSDNKTKGISKIGFLSYYYLPGIIGERLFNMMNIKNNGYIDITEFIQGMKKLFSCNFKDTSKFVFDFYDFDKDSKISSEDIRVVLSYIKSISDSDASLEQQFKERIQTQEELYVILQKCFETVKGDSMNYDQFVYVIENICSDIYLIILLFLLHKKPFTNQNLVTHNNNVNVKNRRGLSTYSADSNKYSNSDNKDSTNKFAKTPSNKLIKVPWKTAQFIDNTFKRKNKKSPTFNVMSGDKVYRETFKMLFPEQNQKNLHLSIQLEGGKSIIEPQPSSQNLSLNSNSFSNNTESLEGEDSSFGNDNLGSNEMPIIHNRMPRQSSPVIPFSFFKPMVKTDEQIEEDHIEYEGYLYKKKDGKMKKLYFKLVNRDFYYFKSQTEKQEFGMHNLSGFFLRKEEPVMCQGKQYFCLSVQNEKKIRYYYTDNELEYIEWYNNLEEAIGLEKIETYYSIGKELGQGKFGKVHLCKNILTGEKFAVKILSKKEMENEDFEMARTEVEILKICQHPNIIRLINIFETPDIIYLVLELCEGGDLFNYIMDRKEALYKGTPKIATAKSTQKIHHILSEEKVCEIIHKLLTALFYLHSFGIAHRDIKANNILITSNDNNFDIKLTDFGLSKIIGPNETCYEPFGTLNYVAPEILLDKPYTKAVDIWSVGILTYFLLSSKFPFRGKTEDELSDDILGKEVSFSDPIWTELSAECKEFIQGMLNKNDVLRFTLQDALCHKWIKKFIKDTAIVEKRMQKETIEKFELYSSSKVNENK